MDRANIRVFFDESGKKDKPNLIGAISIPENIYNLFEFNELNCEIQKISIHWSEYGGDIRERKLIRKIFKVLKKYQFFLNLNVIKYDRSIMEGLSNRFNEKELLDITIYTKFPERVIYGLLRKYGRDTMLNAKIIIEESNEYQKYNLAQKIKEQLNTQALYRAENFNVVESYLKEKQKEVGLEIIDILLGFMRVIIKNKSIGSIHDLSKKQIAKTLLILDMYKRGELELLNQTMYFEWINSNELVKTNFKNYLQIFFANYLPYENEMKKLICKKRYE